MRRQEVFNRFPQDISEFSNYAFNDCDLSQLDLTSKEFIDCTFINCDFSMAIIEHAVFSRVKFIGCKLIGLDFSRCSKYVFSVSFSESILDYCLFHKKKMKKTEFNKCSMKEMTFIECELTNSKFDDCDLTRTLFEKCNLEKSDFSTAYNYELIPSENNIKKAKFAYPGVMGLLRWLDIEILD